MPGNKDTHMCRIFLTAYYDDGDNGALFILVIVYSPLLPKYAVAATDDTPLILFNITFMLAAATTKQNPPLL